MIDLVFVISPTNRNSFAALGGVLEQFASFDKYFKLRIIDEEQVLKEQASEKEKIFCFSFQSFDVARIKTLLRQLKKKNQKAVLVAGGAHSSGNFEQTLKMGFDYVFVGEGEEVFLNFLKEYLSPKKDFGKIKGIAFKRKGEIVFTGKAGPVDITKFLPVSERFPFFTPIEITRGCPYGCYFCQTTYLFGRTRHRTIKQIKKSVEVLVNNGWKKIRFVSPNILVYGSADGLKPNLSQLEKMLMAVRKIKGAERVYAGSFPSEIRPEQVTKKALLLLKKYADNDNLIIGLQSGSNSVLERMHRGHTVEQGVRAIKTALQAGFKVNADFIFASPGETKKEEQETIEILKQLMKLPGVRIHGHTFMPLPGTPWEKEKPGRISKQLREALEELEKSGKLYGDWQEQEKFKES